MADVKRPKRSQRPSRAASLEVKDDDTVVDANAASSSKPSAQSAATAGRWIEPDARRDPFRRTGSSWAGVGRVLWITMENSGATPIQAVLESSGYRVGHLQLGTNDTDILERVATYVPDVIYFVIGEGENAGFDHLEHLASDRRTRYVPLVTVVSRQTPDEVIETAYARSSCDFLRADSTGIELLARTHLLVRLARAGLPLAPIVDASELRVANTAPGDRVELHDAATGVYSLTYFLHRLPLEVSRSRRYQRPLSLLAVRCPQAASSDETAVRVAELLRQRVRSSDLVARVEGGLFAVLLTETPATASDGLRARVAEDLREAGLQHAVGLAGLDEEIANGAFTSLGLLQAAAREAEL